MRMFSDFLISLIFFQRTKPRREKMTSMNWHLVYTTTLYTSAAIIRGKLEENSIPVKMLNRQDSMYISIGEIEIYVPDHLKNIAAGVMNETLRN